MIPLSLQGRGRGPRGVAAWEGEGLSLIACALTPPLLTQWVPPSPLEGEGM